MAVIFKCINLLITLLAYFLRWLAQYTKGHLVL